MAETHAIHDYIDEAQQNDAFRRTVATGEHEQVVLMTLGPGEEIGEETHEHGDQILVFVSGTGNAILAGETTPVREGQLAFVPAGTLHNIVNTGGEALRLVTIYAPPEHPAGTVHETKAEADADEADHH